MTPSRPTIAATRHRVRLLLPVLLVVILAYPLSAVSRAAAVVYAVLYVAVLAAGARVAAVTRWRAVTASALAAFLALLHVPWTLTDRTLWLSVVFLVLLIAFNVLVIAAIGEYLLAAPEVDTDVVFAGTSLYVLVGNAFIPAGLLVDEIALTLTGASAYSGGPMDWASMTYFSFTTLTTLGYGDISPTATIAQALAIGEALLGVLIMALIIGRLVGAVANRDRRHGTD